MRLSVVLPWRNNITQSRACQARPDQDSWWRIHARPIEAAHHAPQAGETVVRRCHGGDDDQQEQHQQADPPIGVGAVLLVDGEAGRVIGKFVTVVCQSTSCRLQSLFKWSRLLTRHYLLQHCSVVQFRTCVVPIAPAAMGLPDADELNECRGNPESDSESRNDHGLGITT